MKTPYLCLPVVALAALLAGCSTPKKDTTALSSQIDAAMNGHYGQAIHHEELAAHQLEKANRILKHWQSDQYWNIDESQKAQEAAKAAAEHRLKSEQEMCQWLTEVHGPNHHKMEAVHHVAAYFKTGSAVPFKTNDEGIAHLGRYLQSHPDASATLTASADTVGKSPSNQLLSENRAAAVSKLLLEHGAKIGQLVVKSIGEGPGPDNTPNQENRIVTISTAHPGYVDCPKLK